mgnify:CR=1 FL=1
MYRVKNLTYAWLAVLPIVLIFALIQTAALDTISIFGVKPDILLIVVILFGFRLGWMSGCITGLISGFLKDIFSGTLLGADSFSFALTGIVAGWLGRRFYAETPIAQVILSFWVALFNHFLYLVVSHPLPLGDAIKFIILPSSAYTALFSVPVFFILRKILLWG